EERAPLRVVEVLAREPGLFGEQPLAHLAGHLRERVLGRGGRHDRGARGSRVGEGPRGHGGASVGQEGAPPAFRPPPAPRHRPAADPDAAHLSVNKPRSRVALRAAGVPVPAFALARDARSVRKTGMAYPLVLKPVASTLGRGVEKVEGDRDLDAAVERLRARLAHSPDVGRLVAFARLAKVDLGCDPTEEFLVEAFAD